jgi:two-component system response regulator DesR
MTAQAIEVLLVDDQELVRSGLTRILRRRDGFAVVGECADGAGVEAAVARLRPDVVVMDLRMRNVDGIEATRRLQARPSPPPVLVLTTFDDDELLSGALRAGAAGFLLKDAPAEELASAVRRVHAGGRAVDPELAAEAWGEEDPLTDRERQVLRLAGDGKPTAAIAGALYLSEGTVRNYLSEAISKLDAANRVEAARIARRKGWL